MVVFIAPMPQSVIPYREITDNEKNLQNGLCGLPKKLQSFLGTPTFVADVCIHYPNAK